METSEPVLKFTTLITGKCLYLVNTVINGDFDVDNHVISFNDRNNYMSKVKAVLKVCSGADAYNEILNVEYDLIRSVEIMIGRYNPNTVRFNKVLAIFRTVVKLYNSSLFCILVKL